MEEQKLLEQCQILVPQILDDRGWLLAEDITSFVKEVIVEVQYRLEHMRPIQRKRRPLKKIIKDATLNCYNQLWYTACGDEGSFYQRQAFEELFQYLYPIALYQANHDQPIAEECSQEALVAVWKSLAQVKDSGSFSRWAGVIVTNLVHKRTKDKIHKNQEISEIDLQLSRTEINAVLPLSTNQETPTITTETWIMIEGSIKNCLKRSQLQQSVIIKHFIEQKGFKEIANELDKTTDNLYVLKTRALTSLRKCQEFLDLLESF